MIAGDCVKCFKNSHSPGLRCSHDALGCDFPTDSQQIEVLRRVSKKIVIMQIGKATVHKGYIFSCLLSFIPPVSAVHK